MKIIHCSDLHLDSRMETNLSKQQALERNDEIRETFARMVRWAQDQDVRAILIAGDLFDTERISTVTADSILDVIAGSPRIDFLYLRGNHDESRRAFAGRTLPQNLKLFSDSWRSIRYGNVVVTGAELTDRNWHTLYQQLQLDRQDVNIVMMHGQESSRMGPEAVCLPALQDRGIRYLALGHLHAFRTGPLDRFGTWCYSGCLEGRGFDECGEKGFVLLQITDDRLEHTFIPFAQRRLHTLQVDITGLDRSSRICAALLEAAGEIPPGDLVKFTLCGAVGPDSDLDPAYLQRTLERRFYHVRIRDESRLALEPGSYEQDISLKGEFIRLVKASGLPEQEQERIIRAGLQALQGAEVTL